MTHESRYDPKWTLYVGAVPPELQQPRPLAPWVRELGEEPRTTIGELEDCPLLAGVLPGAWKCVVMPEYILTHTFVAAVSSPTGNYAMLFFSAVGEELHVQARESKPDLLGWFHVRLVRPVIDAESLAENLRHAFKLLQSQGFIAAA